MKVEEKTNVFESLQGYSDSSQVWVFQTNRTLNKDEALSISDIATKFAASWESHGVAVKASSMLVHNRFLIFIASDDNLPGGCSKDSLVRVIKALGDQFQIDFFDRMQVVFKDGEQFSEVNLHKMSALKASGKITIDTIVYNNLVSNKAELLKNWEIRLEDSWHSNFL